MSAVWVKSSLSFSNGNCVEVASLPGGEIGVRDSRDSQGPVLKFTPGAWDAFLSAARLGEFGKSGSTASPGRRITGDLSRDPLWPELNRRALNPRPRGSASPARWL
jgi:hypothetical protein